MQHMMTNDLKKFLDEKVVEYNRKEFIELDPISIPHRFTLKQDIEIMGFFASVFAWGQRKTIINKCIDLIIRMDGAPYQFIKNHNETDLKQLLGFKHRTFNDTDLLYFIEFFKWFYNKYDSLEIAFVDGMNTNDRNVGNGLNYFRKLFFSLDDFPARTKKHINAPNQNTACKRINMFLRWMVRKDGCGVDFGIWDQIKPSQLICPLDLHVERTARKLGLLNRPQVDWKAAVELTENLKKFDREDPVKYDFALFSISISE